ncbi:D-amino acid dehydrogenase [Roseateles saccharophilus]|uniref:D-amino-acid dehydrogenase n=2 Tax=Roseateles saccharophilus TaxID=304 RepID=A0A4R3VKT1_ROSSA|nr:D-amino acid dehydrogenase [Roseateles saccharophilus]MDG0831344.1 FAD-dependent oxidoreductase [Roseateles saccharophilus]TCV04474.1 D-amino-acid dehydrogenase [Roseateles saccharophilus]
MKHCVVIGGGVVGLTTAWALLERGHAVTLLERDEAVAQGASRANGGQLSYRYVSPLADAGVPLKALRWLLDPDGPLRFKPEASRAQWAWLIAFLRNCRGPVNRRSTERLLALGAYSQAAFARLQAEAQLGDTIALRTPGKLVVYRNSTEFARAAARANAGLEQALSHDDCVALEPALADTEATLAGGIFTPGEAVADCHAFCAALHARLSQRERFRGRLGARVDGLLRDGRGAVRGVSTGLAEVGADAVVLAAGLASRALAATVGVALPLYPLKGYSLTAPIGPGHRPPEVSVTDFEKKILYARIGHELRVAAMVDLVGDDASLDAGRLASLQRSVRATFPHAADYDRATPWAGLRPATPSGAPILGASGVSGLWLNVGHGALGFTFSFATANIVAELVSGRASPLPLDGLTL